MFLVALLLLPSLFVFGVYHLLAWADLFQIGRIAYWKRIALASVLSHAILATGFFAYLYVDFQRSMIFEVEPLDFDVFLFARSDFSWVALIFDTAAVGAIYGLFAALDRAGSDLSSPAALTFALVYVVGSLQWFFVGGAAGAVIGRFWAAMKTGEDDDLFV